MYTKNDQDKVTLVERFDKWDYKDGVGKRLPFLYKQRLTTNPWPYHPSYSPGAITGNWFLYCSDICIDLEGKSRDRDLFGKYLNLTEND